MHHLAGALLEHCLCRCLYPCPWQQVVLLEWLPLPLVLLWLVPWLLLVLVLLPWLLVVQAKQGLAT